MSIAKMCQQTENRHGVFQILFPLMLEHISVVLKNCNVFLYTVLELTY